MRLNKYLAHQGISTRRGADEMIEKKKIIINGRIAVLGDKVQETDKVEVAGTIPTAGDYLYYAYNKPVGVITHSPQIGEKDIKQALAKERGMQDVYPVGRLDTRFRWASYSYE